MDGADDEAGELPPLDPESPAEPLPHDYCVTAEEPPYEGIRHHCGGTIDLSISGDALGDEVDEDIAVNFGPNTPGDSYEHPRVAACCGEYDFEQIASNQPVYWKNCLYDAVQQTCAALPHYLWEMAAAAKAENKHVVADQLTKLGNDLGTGDSQYACIEALFGTGPVDFFNVITDNAWNPAYDVWITVDFLEILEVALPEDPADWATCKSIYENEDTVMPNMDPGPIWDALGFDAGGLGLSDSDIRAQLVPDGSSELLLSFDASGSLLLGALQLRGGRWQISSLRTQRGHQQSDGSFSVPAGALYFVAAAVVDGHTFSVSATNATALNLRETDVGWTIQPFSLVYNGDDGDAWTLGTAALDFLLR